VKGKLVLCIDTLDDLTTEGINIKVNCSMNRLICQEMCNIELDKTTIIVIMIRYAKKQQ
jgi:hypothetical protein